MNGLLGWSSSTQASGAQAERTNCSGLNAMVELGVFFVECSEWNVGAGLVRDMLMFYAVRLKVRSSRRGMRYVCDIQGNALSSEKASRSAALRRAPAQGRRASERRCISKVIPHYLSVESVTTSASVSRMRSEGMPVIKALRRQEATNSDRLRRAMQVVQCVADGAKSSPTRHGESDVLREFDALALDGGWNAQRLLKYRRIESEQTRSTKEASIATSQGTIDFKDIELVCRCIVHDRLVAFICRYVW